MSAPSKEKRGVRTALIAESKLRKEHRARRSFKGSPAKRRKRKRDDKRECVCCGVPVTNRNLGGHSGKSALTGSLLCLRCEDGLGNKAEETR